MKGGLIALGGLVAVLVAAVVIIMLVRVPQMYAIEGHGEVKYTPKEAEITASIYTENAVSVDAVKEAAATMRQILVALKNAGVTNEDIKTADVRSGLLDTERSREAKDEKPFYYAEQIVIVSVHEIGKIGKILDVIAAAGSNYWLVTYTVPDAERAALEAKAREAAFLNAVATADAYAKNGRFTRGKVLKIQDDDVSFPEIDYPDRSYRTHRDARVYKSRDGDKVEKVTVTGTRIANPDTTFDIPPPRERKVSATTQVLFEIE